MNLKNLITHAKRRRVSIKDLEECLKHKDEAIFSLIGTYGEINSYMLNFEQALNMVDPAIDEDGFIGSELEIRILT